MNGSTIANTASGFPIVFRGASQAQPTYIETLGYIAFGDYKFEALGTLSRTYQAPSGFKRTGTTTAILTWNAATRWDARRFVLRFASGATPPATIVAGTGITLGGTPDGNGVVTVTHSPGAGTYSYSLFAVYDDVNGSSDVAVSAPQTLASLVVS